MSKRFRLVFLVAFISILAVTGVTIAYFTSGEFADNEFKVGENSIEVDEDFTPPTELTTGANTYKKAVSISNTGSVPCYIRVFADFSESSIREISKISSDNGVNYYDPDSMDWLPADWEYISLADDPLLGGYYYYTEQVEPGEDSGNLFTNIETTFADEAEIRDYDIIVSAESVQVRDKNGELFTGSDPWKQAWNEFLSRRGN